LWKFDDRHPLPRSLNTFARFALYLLRRVRFFVLAQLSAYRCGASGQEALVGSIRVSNTMELVSPLDSSKAANCAQERFEHVNQVNRRLRTNRGAWHAQPHAIYYGQGVSIEEVALRVLGYMAAFRATGLMEYLDEAREGCSYLRTYRIYADGHLRLQGHQVIDMTYAYGGAALLSVYEHTGNKALLSVARRIGDRLIEYHISGSVNHAVVPAYLLEPLYRYTGDVRYRNALRKRLFRTAVPFQLPYGGWLGHESWIWYHAIITKSLVLGYSALPFDLQHQSDKDRLARTITAALNRFIEAFDAAQASFRIRPEPPLCETTEDEVYYRTSNYSEQSFKSVRNLSGPYGAWNGYVLDALITAYEHLDVHALTPLIDQFGCAVCRSREVSRLEFDTLGAGRFFEYVATIRDRNRLKEV